MVTHLLSTWETPEEAHGPNARFSVWVPAETTCLGRKTPDRCMLHAATACSGAGQHFQGYDMEPRNQVQLNAAEIIGMDAHSRKLSLCLARKEGDRYFRVTSITTTLDALEATYLNRLPPASRPSSKPRPTASTSSAALPPSAAKGASSAPTSSPASPARTASTIASTPKSSLSPPFAAATIFAPS